jgi:hypothetical protein
MFLICNATPRRTSCACASLASSAAYICRRPDWHVPPVHTRQHVAPGAGLPFPHPSTHVRARPHKHAPRTQFWAATASSCRCAAAMALVSSTPRRAQGVSVGGATEEAPFPSFLPPHRPTPPGTRTGRLGLPDQRGNVHGWVTPSPARLLVGLESDCIGPFFHVATPSCGRTMANRAAALAIGLGAVGSFIQASMYNGTHAVQSDGACTRVRARACTRRVSVRKAPRADVGGARRGDSGGRAAGGALPPDQRRAAERGRRGHALSYPVVPPRHHVRRAHPATPHRDCDRHQRYALRCSWRSRCSVLCTRPCG